MADLFLRILNMSIAASWLVLAVVALRLLLKKAPRWSMVLLWGIVALRLLCPFSIESALSLIPSAQTVSPDIMLSPKPSISSGISALNATINPVIGEALAPTPSESVNPMQVLIYVASAVWVVGMVGMALYAVISYYHLRRRVATAVLQQDNIFRSEYVASPFVLGLLRPRIYLPCGMEAEDQTYVIAHEQAHIRRGDHWWKPLGFVLLTLHWFNPLMWMAYIFLCRDIEVACDEKVIKELAIDQRADYSEALLSCSVKRTMIAACPLAFGEVGVKERVKNVLSYKKPAFWIIIVAVIACVSVAVCFLTDPITEVYAENTQPNQTQTVQNVPGPLEKWYRITGWADRQTGQFQVEAFPGVTFRWNIGTVEAVTEKKTTVIIDALSIHDIGAVDLNLDGYPEICATAVRSTEEHSCYVIVYDYAAGKTYTFPSGDGNTGYYLYTRSDYLMCGKERLEEDETYESGRLMLTGTNGNMELTIVAPPQPAKYTGNAVLWYDKTSPDSPLKAQVELEAFPGVVFKWDHSALIHRASEGIVAVKNGVETDLFPNGFVESVYVADVTGDGNPDICANVYFFRSGMPSFNTVQVYDQVDEKLYVLADDYNKNHSKMTSYYLRLEGGSLICEKVHVATSQVLAVGTVALDDCETGKQLYLKPQITFDSPVEYSLVIKDEYLRAMINLTTEADGTCRFSISVFNSDSTGLHSNGTYTKSDGKLFVHTEDGKTYTFRFQGDDLVFLEKESDALPKGCGLYDGAVLEANILVP